MNFPSVMYFWEAQRQLGAHVHMVKTEDGVHVPTERLLEAIDEDTLLVPISHVVFRSSYIKDVKAIIEKAHGVGAHVVLDAFQSLGNVPLDVQALNVDFATGGVLKWLCGGPGTAYLYVRPDLGRKLEPKLTGWFAHENPFAFAVGPNKYGEPPYRFMQGTSNVPGYYAALPGLRIIREIGVERIREKSKKLTARLIELADQRGWRVNAPRDPEHRGGTVAISMPNSSSEAVCKELLRRNVIVDWRPQAGVRFSPHFYNTMEETDQAIRMVDEILSAMKIPAGAAR
jgi:kynureninase